MSGDKYKLYKLRSGEEIVSKVVSATSKKVTLFRPMQVKMSTLLDRNSGMTRDIVLLRRWLDNTFEINCELPLDYVALELKPTPDLISRYLMELEREDAYYDAMRDMEDTKKEEGDEPQSSEFLERLMSDLENLKEMNDSVEEMMQPEDIEEENHIMMNFLLPPEIFLNIMNTINEDAEADSDEFNMSDLQSFLKRLREHKRTNSPIRRKDDATDFDDREIEDRFADWDPQE